MAKRYRLHADCIAVRGYRNCVVCDTSQQDVFSISENAYSAMADGNLIDPKMFDAVELDALISNNLVYECPLEVADLFPPMPADIPHPMAIKTAIVEFDAQKKYDINSIIVQLSTLGCGHLQFWTHTDVGFDAINALLASIDGKNIINVDVVLRHDCNDLTALAARYPFVFSITAYDAPRTGIKKHACCNIFSTTETFKGAEQCGVVAPNQFVCNREFFFLSANHNTCLYRKLSIDREGYIRNCPASPQHFGRVGEVSLAEAMAHPDFSRLWGITKEQVDVCCHCEFRRICPDCRVFTHQPERPTAHPARCTYNPYLARWQGQPGYAPVEQCGTFTPQGFQPDAERIERLLRERPEVSG